MSARHFPALFWVLWGGAIVCSSAAPTDHETRKRVVEVAGQQLTARILGQTSQASRADMYKQFVCEWIPPENNTDVFELESDHRGVILRGNNGVSIASAFQEYLKTVAHCDPARCGAQLRLPYPLPPVPQKIHRAATVPHRFIYNYCTFGYTMPWWHWKDWERELDWLAMNGINMPFIITGQEAVWIRTFTQFGYTEKEIREWLGSPAHFPWTFMQNMQNFGGELPAAWVPQRVDLARKILSRARELGMTPVLQGYYGMVPPNFSAKHPGAKILPQGRWAGSLQRPDMLNPSDPLFEKIAAVFMREQEALFGRAGYYAGDPFHEGGNSHGVDLVECGRRVFSAMTNADPRAVWVKQCWQTDNRALLSGVPADRVLALDLHAESKPYWPQGAFHGRAWVWCLLHNFGGNNDLNGDLAHLANAFSKTLVDPQRGNLSGLAFVPEGHCNAPAVYALMTEFIWKKEPIELTAWLPDYLRRRYGAESKEAITAWEGLLATVYGVSYAHEGPANSILAARPLRGEKARTWSSTQIPYDAARLISAWDHLLAAAPECGASDGYRYDLADITRQVLANYTRKTYDRAMTAMKNQDLPAFERAASAFLDTLDDLDTVLLTRREFLLGPWLRDARTWGTTPEEKNLYEKQARMLLTLWDAHPGSDLNDYANRQWSGLVEYYRMRWQLYFNTAADAMRKNNPLDKGAFLDRLGKAELDWMNRVSCPECPVVPDVRMAKNTPPCTPRGDIVAIARALREKYKPLLR